MLVAARAGQVLADLGVAVGHEATSEPSRSVESESSSHRPAGAKPSKLEQGSAVEDDFADLDHARQVDQCFVIDFIAAQQFGVVAEVAQEPAQLPQRFGCAVEAAGHETCPVRSLGLEDGEADLVIRFLLVPAILGSIHPDQEDPVRNE